MGWESMDKHLSGKLMLISDCKTPHMKFDGMYFITQILIDGDQNSMACNLMHKFQWRFSGGMMVVTSLQAMLPPIIDGLDVIIL